MATALLVLDMLDDFVTGKLANPAAEQIVEAIGGFGADGPRPRRLAGGSTATTPTRRATSNSRCLGEHAMAYGRRPGEPGYRGHRPRSPGDILVPKRYYSAFTQTDLDATCRVHGIDRFGW